MFNNLSVDLPEDSSFIMSALIVFLTPLENFIGPVTPSTST